MMMVMNKDNNNFKLNKGLTPDYENTVLAAIFGSIC
jgi:hypothetical protein